MKIFLCMLGVSVGYQAQSVGINTNTPHVSAVLEIKASEKGLLLPRLSSQAIIDLTSTAAEGLVVFDKEKKLFLGFNGSTWLNLSYSENNTPPYFVSSPSMASSNGNLLGTLLSSNATMSDDNSADIPNLSPVYKWLRASDANGLLASNTNSNSATYGTSLVDKNKFLQVCITPTANTGASPGVEKCSNWFGPILEFSAANIRLAAWETTGLSAYGPSPWDPTSTNNQLSLVGLSRAAGLKTTGIVAAANAWGALDWNQPTAADAILNADYVSFSIKPNTGKIMSMSKLNAHNLRRSATGASLAQWQYSTDGINYQNIGPEISLPNTTAAGNNVAEINLANTNALQNLPSTSLVTFRLLGYGGGGGTFYINNLTGNDLELMGSIQ